MRSILASALAASLVVAALAPRLAHAEARPMSAEAKRAYERGKALVKSGDYAAAIATFDAAFEVEPHPDFLYVKGQAQRMMGDCAGAIASYRGFLASSPPKREAEVTRYNLARCEQELTRAKPVEPAPQPVFVVTERGTPWYRDTLGGVLAGGAVLGAGVGVTFFVLADRSVDRANDADTLEIYLAEKDRVSTRRTIGAIAVGVGGALAIGAVIRYATRPGSVRVAAPASGEGAVVSIGGEF
jgi:tetratricopeptide (TPR) repeat protein